MKKGGNNGGEKKAQIFCLIRRKGRVGKYSYVEKKCRANPGEKKRGKKKPKFETHEETIELKGRNLLHRKSMERVGGNIISVERRIEEERGAKTRTAARATDGEREKRTDTTKCKKNRWSLEAKV